ncbi:hypothetical protein SKAU_G00038410 [Synaphobranchus kaupii]|uniref:Uncharacterized protein n=1 Tax=Synaphobranchus kaupii TaxID=118154 RepID=A0A9Q1GGJ0_SYNKA|nr:hypothetical protein SKAU_G00038410 [Synaphobranchus kaupii]
MGREFERVLSLVQTEGQTNKLSLGTVQMTEMVSMTHQNSDSVPSNNRNGAAHLDYPHGILWVGHLTCKLVPN